MLACVGRRELRLRKRYRLEMVSALADRDPHYNSHWAQQRVQCLGSALNQGLSKGKPYPWITCSVSLKTLLRLSKLDLGYIHLLLAVISKGQVETVRYLT